MKLLIGLMLGNFVWQLISRQYDWIEAVKLSYFQSIAVGVYWLGRN